MEVLVRTPLVVPWLALGGILVGPASLFPPPRTLNFTAVTAASDHTCGLTSAGRVFCWGDNTEGELGIGTRLDMTKPVGLPATLVFLSIDAGTQYTCGITDTGEAYCWGANDRGQLGNAATPRSLVPTPVTGGLRFIDIAAGGEFTCGVSDNGVAYCWGANESGQLGRGGDDTASSARPLPVASSQRFVSITAGGSHACAIAADSSAYCWGNNHLGQLGIGRRGNASTPQPVTQHYKWSMVSAGGRHTCGILADRRPIVYCWGDNFHGQISGNAVNDGTLAPSYIPRPTFDASGIVGVTSGRMHTCAYRRLTTISVGCWGWNLDFQLGQRTFGPFVQVSAGDAHTCAVRKDGAIYCWGRNASGQLGDGTMFTERYPVQVVDPVAV